MRIRVESADRHRTSTAGLVSLEDPQIREPQPRTRDIGHSESSDRMLRKYSMFSMMFFFCSLVRPARSSVLNYLAVLIENGITHNGGCPLLRRLIFLSFLWHWNTQVRSRRTESSGLHQKADGTVFADSLQYFSNIAALGAITPPSFSE